LKTPNRWGPPIDERRRGAAYRFGEEEDGPWAESRARPDWLTGALFYSLFLFCFCYLFHKFFICASKEFKSVSKVFKNS
jgi:hypothetical protein